MKDIRIKGIIITIVTILFMLLIPNCVKAATFSDNYTVEGIYRSMNQYKEQWLNTTPFGTNYAGWRLTQKNAGGNGFRGSLIWSTGGGCCGHGQQAGTYDTSIPGDRHSKNSCI